MINFFTFPSILSFLACVLTGVLYAWILYRKNKHLSKVLTYTLGLFRAVTITLICWLLFAPLFKKLSYTPEKPIIILAHDNSLSISQIKAAGFDEQAYQKNMQKLAAELSSKYEVRTYSFSDSVKSVLDFTNRGRLSNGSALISQLNNELLNRNIGAVIIASDGIFNRGGNPLYDLKQLKAPVYTIALGDTIPKKDVVIANINYNDLVYLDNEFTLDIQVQAFQASGETAQLSVLENGVKVKTENVNFNSNSFTKNIPIKLNAHKIGIQKYTIAISAVKNEITTKNNTQTIFVEVIDARQKILLAAAAPHPDIATLKHAIEQNKHYEVTVALADDLAQVKLNAYNLAILYQLPALNNTASNFIDRARSAKIALWYILGTQSNTGKFNEIQEMVKMSQSGNTVQEIFPYVNPTFSLFNLDATAIKQLGEYDPLLAPFGALTANVDYSAVLNQKIGKVTTPTPMLFFVNSNEKKTGFLIGEGLWKWKLEEAKEAQNIPLLDELVSKTLQYLTVKDDKRKFKVYASKATFDESEPIILNANLYNDAYEPVNSAEVEVKIRAANGKLFNYVFSKLGTAYRLDAGNLPEGNYSYVATTNLGDKHYSATGAFYINALITEYQQTTANHQLLYTMAHQNNGKMFMPSNLLFLADELAKNDQIKTITYEDRTYEELINFKWLFGLILILLSMEWFLRKRNGEI
ncbi:MAG: hypothetical protein V4541_02160 [Bacteroidota bacterium]